MHSEWRMDATGQLRDDKSACLVSMQRFRGWVDAWADAAILAEPLQFLLLIGP